MAAGAPVVRGAEAGDGKPDTLQELALAVAGAGPPYDAAFDRDGADDRSIVSGFLFRTDRVELLPTGAGDPVLGADPGIDHRGGPLAHNADVSNPKALNATFPADVDRSTGTDGPNVFTRAPQVGRFRLWRAGIGTSTFADLWAVTTSPAGPTGGRASAGSRRRTTPPLPGRWRRRARSGCRWAAT